MKKIVLPLAVAFSLLSCNNDAGTGADNTATDAPSAVDTGTQHPNGMTNGSVISTDTAAMNMNNANKNAQDRSKK